ncbi:hypothetical protein [Brevundimonas sp. R86498]|uniref:hypothetical protein n=1 Tax=Brevundimonas sp. R86498 TaxID=3093845 RepID=UPI0037CC556C
MAGYGRHGFVILLAASIAAGSANAQTLQRSELLGDWTLRLTPAEGGEGRVTVKTDSGRLEMPLVVTARGSSDLTCTVDDEPADCRLRRGELIVSVRIDSARMIYSLNGRRNDGFHGNVRMTLPLLPFGSMDVGNVAMTRR